MTVYVLAQLKFTDVARYRRYQERFMDVFRPSGGRLLIADEAPQVLEGIWPGDKVVLMAFESEAQARAFQEDAAYQTISEDRKAGADTVALMLRGTEMPHPEDLP